MRIAIYGYGNIARGVESAVAQNDDAELVGVFTRRDPAAVATVSGAPVFAAADIDAHADNIDVVVICGGSATDLPEQTPALARRFNVVDSFDNHTHIPEHFANVDNAAQGGGNVAVISGGWDPGLFSLARLYSNIALPQGTDYTFWGYGVSQGHSDAVRRIAGVADARQYTVPVPEALDAIRAGECPELTARQKHTRLVYVVAAEGADTAEIERQIVTMPDYFEPYDTTVHFISAEEMAAEHAGMPHGGFVIRNGKTGFNQEHNETFEFRLALDSNPEFTGSILVALARAAYRMSQRGASGCKTVFDIAPADLSPLSGEELRAHLL